MNDEGQGPVLYRDDALTNELRAIVAPPADPGYWDALERRILARLDRARDDGRWWAFTERTYQLGMVAAALVLIVAGSVWLRQRAVETRMAYESVIETAADDQPRFARRDPLDEHPAASRGVRAGRGP